jgi:hypothetical protein
MRRRSLRTRLALLQADGTLTIEEWEAEARKIVAETSTGNARRVPGWYR